MNKPTRFEEFILTALLAGLIINCALVLRTCTHQARHNSPDTLLLEPTR